MYLKKIKSMVWMFREYGLFVKHCRVEVYLTELCLALNSDPENKIKMKFSKADTIGKEFN